MTPGSVPSELSGAKIQISLVPPPVGGKAGPWRLAGAVAACGGGVRAQPDCCSGLRARGAGFGVLWATWRERDEREGVAFLPQPALPVGGSRCWPRRPQPVLPAPTDNQLAQLTVVGEFSRCLTPLTGLYLFYLFPESHFLPPPGTNPRGGGAPSHASTCVGAPAAPAPGCLVEKCSQRRKGGESEAEPACSSGR